MHACELARVSVFFSFTLLSFSSFFFFLSLISSETATHRFTTVSRRSSTRVSLWGSPATSEATPRSLAWDDQWRSCGSHQSSTSSICFLHFSAPSSVFSGNWDHIWNVLSMIYKIIPLLLANLVLLESPSVFTSWLLRLFLAKPSRLLRWNTRTINVHFISFDLIYILLCFVKFWKYALRDQNWYFNYCLDLRAETTEAWNWNLRPPTDSFQHHESHGGLRILKRASIRKLVFRGEQFCTVLHENSIYVLPGLCFEK